MNLSIKLHNADNIINTFKRAPDIAYTEYMVALEQIALTVQQMAYKDAPIGKVAGGNLRQSIRMSPIGRYGFVVEVGAQYGIYVDQGTRPHVILPKTKKMLAFKIDGRWIYSKRVNHPGTKAQPFFTNAVDYAEKYGAVAMDQAIIRVLAQI